MIKEAISKDIIDINMNCACKEEAIRHLSSILFKQGYITDIDEFVKDVYVRENECMTGIGENIAIPHAKSSAAKKTGLAIGKNNRMIEWESLDEQPVNIIILFCVSEENFERNHLLLLSEVSRKLVHEEIIERLKSDISEQEIIDLFCSD